MDYGQVKHITDYVGTSQLQIFEWVTNVGPLNEKVMMVGLA